MTGPDELTTADGRDRAIRDRCAAFMASAGEIVVSPSGFGWEDTNFRWLARDANCQFYAYASTADQATSDLLEVMEEGRV